MYNRYLHTAAEAPPLYYQTPAGFIDSPAAESTFSSSSSGQEHNTQKALADLTKTLSSRLQNIKFDMDTVLMLAIVWFLLSDNGEIDWEELLTIGVLFILGI